LTENEFQRLVGHAQRHRWLFRIVCFVLGPAAAIYGLSNNPTGSVWSLALTLLGGAMIGGAIGDIRSTRRYGTKLFLEQDKVYGDARAVIDDNGITIEGTNGLVSSFPWTMFNLVEDLGDYNLSM
jgi:hypothetical protein